MGKSKAELAAASPPIADGLSIAVVSFPIRRSTSCPPPSCSFSFCSSVFVLATAYGSFPCKYLGSSPTAEATGDATIQAAAVKV